MPTQEELDAQNETKRTTPTRAGERKVERRTQTFVGSGGEREERVFEDGSRVTQNDSSWGGDVKGAIFDVSTNTYTPKTDNQQGIGEDTSQRGIDSYQAPVDPVQSPINGVPDGYVEKAGVIVENGTRVAGSILFKES